jgi:beta-galactosidase beta subunit
LVVDIQLTLEGDEQIGWRPVSEMPSAAGPCDDAREVASMTISQIPGLGYLRGYFAIFSRMTHTRHSGAMAMVKKAIFKIAI